MPSVFVLESAHLCCLVSTQASAEELREECSFLLFVAILRMLNILRKNQYDEALALIFKEV